MRFLGTAVAMGDCPGCPGVAGLHLISCTCLETPPAVGHFLSHIRDRFDCYVCPFWKRLPWTCATSQEANLAVILFRSPSKAVILFCVPLKEQIPGLAEGWRSGVTPRRPQRGWRPRGAELLTSVKGIEVKRFPTHSFSEDGDACWGFAPDLQRSGLDCHASVLARGYVSAPGCPRSAPAAELASSEGTTATLIC